MKQSIRRALLVVALLVAGRTTAHAQFQVIVNGANAAASVTKADVNRMFLKKMAKWPDGKPVAAVDLEKASSTRDAFSKAVLGRAASAVNSYWQQQIFSGGDTPPPEKSSDADVIAFVKGNPGAIGYVSSGADVSGVKVLTVK